MISQKFLPSLFRLLTLVLISLTVAALSAQDKVDFATKIKPILEEHCIACHGPVEKDGEENDFRIDDRDDAMDFIGTGGAEESDLFQLMASDDEEEKMPPPEHSVLTDEQMTLVKTWIDEGADWPEDVKLVIPVQEPETDAGTEENPNTDTSTETEGTDTAGTEDSTDDGSTDAPAPPAAKIDKQTQQVFNAIGSLHTAAVHLPIGLLLASGLFALFSLRGNFVMSDCAYYCLWLGTLGAIFACVSGWWYSPMEHRGTVVEFGDMFDQTHDIFWHRTGGIIVTAAALVLAMFAAGARSRDPDDGSLWKLGLILLACGIGWVGHTGGELAYPNQYKDLNAVYERLIGGDDPVVVPVQDDANVGKASGETEPADPQSGESE